MTALLFWILVYCLVTASSIVLTGDRGMISGDLWTLSGALRLFFNWKFVAAMALAVVSRLTFVLVNNALLKIPSLSRSSTTLTTLVLTLSYIFVIGANMIWLSERLTWTQGIGASLILLGVVIIMR